MAELKPVMHLDYDTRPRRVNSESLKSFTLGILCIPFLLLMGLGVFPAVFAIHLGRMALVEMREETSFEGRNLAIVGIMLGIIGLVLFAGIVMFFVVVAAMGGSR